MPDRRSLDAEVGALIARANAADEMRHEMRATLERIEQSVKSIPRLCAEIKEIKPYIEDYKKIKQRGIGIGFMLVAAGGFLTHIVSLLAAVPPKLIALFHTP